MACLLGQVTPAVVKARDSWHCMAAMSRAGGLHQSFAMLSAEWDTHRHRHIA